MLLKLKKIGLNEAIGDYILGNSNLIGLMFDK